MAARSQDEPLAECPECGGSAMDSDTPCSRCQIPETEKDGPGGNGYDTTEECPLCEKSLGRSPLSGHLPDCPQRTEVLGR